MSQGPPKLFLPFHPGRFLARQRSNRRARRYAVMVGVGWSHTAIARHEKVATATVYHLLHAGCPPFVNPTLDPGRTSERAALPAPGRRLPEPPRPEWTFPDEQLLQIAHEARDEIEHNLRRKTS